MKREAKQQKWLDTKDEYKKKQKEKKKLNPPSRKNRFVHLNGINSDGEITRLKRKDIEAKYRELVKAGQTIIIDCDFEDKMDGKQIRSMS